MANIEYKRATSHKVSNFICYCLTLMFFVFAVQAFSNHDGGIDVIGFSWWVAMTWGMIIGIRRTNKKDRAKFDALKAKQDAK